MVLNQTPCVNRDTMILNKDRATIIPQHHELFEHVLTINTKDVKKHYID